MTNVRVVEWTRPWDEIYRVRPSRDVYYAWRPHTANPYLAHYCLNVGGRPRWIWQGTELHTLVSREPLHLEASIGWTACCGRHGFIRNGQWEPAGDFGWMADPPVASLPPEEDRP